MLVFLFLLGLALGAVSSSDDPPTELQQDTCPSFWFSFNGRCYKYFNTETTWADAELYCVSQGGNLVSIHSREEEDFVKFLIKSSDPAEGYTWIGLHDIAKEGRWMWSDGCAVKFVYWSSGQPDNFRGLEHCVDTNFGFDHKWNDRTCYSTLPSVCASRITCP
ncbi:galactose-specific lectin nattectin-like [Trematomus bernacchii]|uniref:galactose-specific lectin nattectin-like n=1 Tax=Trematomus bernacchii TaxID=40690 RepID=UPI00146CCE0C|nr:galactose-specific lectin nattectin-like [Trematomus bernacchii]